MVLPRNTQSTEQADFYLDTSERCPLLTAEQERAIDRRKWAASRHCLRLIVSDSGGRELLLDFTRRCIEAPPVIEAFDARTTFFVLRRDIGDLVPEGKYHQSMPTLVTALEKADHRAVLELCASMAWPCTLVAALVSLQLRKLGQDVPDPVSDAMLAWQPGLAFSKDSPRNQTELGRWLKRYIDARDRLVLHNLRLVHKLARDQSARGLPFSDLVQEGIVGLVRAAEKYQSARGFRFSTYAYPWINQHLQRATEGRGSLISYPAHVIQDINKLHKLRMNEQEATGRDPGPARLVELSGMSEDKVYRLRSLTNITVSIDHPDDDDPVLASASKLEDPDSLRAQEETDQRSLSRLLKQRIARLEAREQAVIRARWGLDGRPQLTFSQLAEQLNVSREWVRQLEKSAIEKLSGGRELQQAFAELEH